MAAYISVPRDLTRVKSKVFFNLTKRQLICFGAGALIGVPTFFLLRQLGNVSLAVMGMMIVMLPLFFLGMYEKDGQPLEVIAKQFIQAKFIRPKVRPYQTNNYYAALIRQAEAEQEVQRIVLNSYEKKGGKGQKRYGSFTERYGLINSRGNSLAFSEDSSYYLLCSLENIDEDGQLIGKADMFTKRTIRPERKVTSVDTPSEALAISIGEKGAVDLPFMAELLGTPGEYDAIVSGLHGVIFKDPMGPDAPEEGWQTADEYLSGNVRDKLRIATMAADRDPAFAVNVEALTKAQPKDLDASEIDVRLGATWIDPKYFQQFMHETFQTPFYMRRTIEVKYSTHTAEWRITGKTQPRYDDVAANMTFGTSRANAYRILEDTLNLKDVRIYDTVEDADGKQKRVLNKKETTLAQQKQQAIKDAFQDWVWKDPKRREALCQKYNELFNSTRPREFDGSHIHFVGMNPEIMLREHQRNAIAHVLYGGNTLLAHEVGAGKTFEMAAAAMESKRLGLCQKSMFVVPNHLTLQWANEFLRLYPSAKLLVTTKKDFETSRRKKFCARIATGDYDAVIIGHSQFEKIPISAERQKRQLREQIEDIEDAIAELKYSRGENFTIKQMEKTRKSLQARLNKLTSTERKDDVITFEQLGVDRLFVDESQAYKNLFLYTKMRNVAGLSTSEAQRSSDMFMKCRYMDEITGGRGVVFASGTPVSNSMTELYTVMRYLQYSTLQQKGLTHFDSWASTFGETTTAIELSPEGTGYRARTRFARFFNLPELMTMFKEVADIKTSDQLDLPVPEADFQTIVVQPSEIQKEMVASLSERAAKVHAGAVDASVDNMLCITSDGRKIGLDQRLMNPLLPDDPGSKLNACVNNVFQIWQDGVSDRTTQLLFCDMSTPKGDGSFNVYDDIRGKLEAMGVPHEEIAFIHDADTEVKKKDLFAKVRSGQVRILLGSTQKMGAGTNVQDRLIAAHHLDVGWRPADMTQRNGRIIRQGKRKFKDFHLSGLAVQRCSDIICVEHGLSIIEKKPYRERTKRTEYPKKETFRDTICTDIDAVMKQNPKDFEEFLQLLTQKGYEVKRGKNTALRGKGQTRFIRFRSLGEGYSEEEIRAVLLGEKAHRSKFKSRQVHGKPKFNLLVDIDEKMQAKGIGYQRWATVYNLKQMAQTMIFIREHGIESLDDLQQKTDAASAWYDELSDRLKASEKRLVEIAALKTHIINYSKTRDTYVEYRKSGYSKKFFEAHRTEITLHKEAKNAFDQLGVKKLPMVKDLSAEYAQVLAEKKATYAEYRAARSEMQEYQKARHKEGEN